MAYDPTDAEVDAYEADRAATMTPVIVAQGPLPTTKHAVIDGAFRGIMFWSTLQGLPRILIEADDELVLEITRNRLVSARMESKMFSSEATVEFYARKETDDGTRECVVIAGPKRNLKTAFASIGCTL